MSKELIKTPVTYTNVDSHLRDGNGVLIAEVWGGALNTKTGEITPLGTYIATCLNQHTALVGIAEAAEAVRQHQVRNEWELPPVFSELEARLAEWKKIC